MVNEELNKKYLNLINKKEELETDIKDSYEALEDKKIDHLTITEIKNDIIEDKRQLDIINKELEEIKKEQNKENQIELIINEDGTDALSGYPINPLEEKWNRLYPSIPKPEYSQVCDGYSCMWCDRCPKGSEWKVPEEDLELWNKYRKEIDEYNKIHNPKMYQLVMDNRRNK